MNHVNLSAWAAFAGVDDPGLVAAPPSDMPPKPSRARAREESSRRTATATKPIQAPQTRQMSLLGAGRAVSTATATTATPVDPGPRWTLSDWIDDGAGLLRFWLPRDLCRPIRVAACVEPDDRSNGWTIIVMRPVGQGDDAVVWWSGGAYGRLELVEEGQLPREGERRVRRGGHIYRVVEVPVPHSTTLEDAQRRADATLGKLARRFGGGH